MKRKQVVLLLLLLLVGSVFSAPVKRRLAWPKGVEKEVRIFDIQDANGFHLETSADTNEVTFVLKEDGVYMKWKPLESGLRNFTFNIYKPVAPPFENWSGEVPTQYQTATVNTWVFEEPEGNFLSGGPDILVSGSAQP